jgi:hypothetical protein
MSDLSSHWGGSFIQQPGGSSRYSSSTPATLLHSTWCCISHRPSPLVLGSRSGVACALPITAVGSCWWAAAGPWEPEVAPGSLADEVDVELEEVVLICLLLARGVHIQGQPWGGVEGALKTSLRLLRLSYFIIFHLIASSGIFCSMSIIKCIQPTPGALVAQATFGGFLYRYLYDSKRGFDI